MKIIYRIVGMFVLLISVNCYAYKWECVKESPDYLMCDFKRMAVPHGWLVYFPQYPEGLTYVPDEKHEWKV